MADEKQIEHVELLKELHRAFDFFNERFSEGTLNRPIITIQTAGRTNVLGWFLREGWEGKTPEDITNEINISAEYFDRGATDVLETLLHEMAHLKNFQLGIEDCSKSQYHNIKFKVCAESFGLIVEKMKNRGWAYTQLGEDAQKAIEDLNPNEDLFKLTRRRGGKKHIAKYHQLIVELNYKDKAEALAEALGMSKKDAIQQLIDDACIEHGVVIEE